ncbi:MAG: glycosyltransferase family 2 protein [Gaiellales bacterium]
MRAMGPAVVVVSYRTSAHLAACLAAIAADDPGVPIYVADNASDAVALAGILEHAPAAVPLATSANPGFAGGVNRGARRAFEDGASHVLILNDDVLIEPGAVARLAEAAGVGDVAAPFLDGRGDGEFRGGRIDWATGIAGHEEGATDYLCAACLMISRGAWDAVGAFDESFFLYFEDVDWCVRASTCGVRLVLVPEVLAWHEGGASTGGGASPLVAYWWTRNRLRFVRKHRGYGAALGIAATAVVRSARRGGGTSPVDDGVSGADSRGSAGGGQVGARLRGLIAGLVSPVARQAHGGALSGATPCSVSSCPRDEP